MCFMGRVLMDTKVKEIQCWSSHVYQGNIKVICNLGFWLCVGILFVFCFVLFLCMCSSGV
jgi:hypothetical protein